MYPTTLENVFIRWLEADAVVELATKRREELKF